MFHILLIKFISKYFILFHTIEGFPGDSVVKNPAASAEDMGLIPGAGKYPGESLSGKSDGQSSLLVTVHGVSKESDTT